MDGVAGRGAQNPLDADDGSGSSLDGLVPFVYDELHRIAHRELAAEASGRTLTTTALVHEAYLRLAGSAHVARRGRAYFFAAAARAMRRILVDEARSRRRLKRGGGVRAVTLGEAATALARDELDLLDLERGLESLATLAARPARVIECRFYGGMSVEDTAEALGVTTRTVKRDWAFARAWLFDYLNDAEARS